MAARFSLPSAMLFRALRGTCRYQRYISAAPSFRLASNVVPGEGRAVLESTEEFKFVERLIPPSQVPDPPHYSGPSPSGWIPPAESPPDLPYMIRRSRMHNVPVYSDITHGNRKMTLIRKVEGDIWALEKQVKEHLKALTGKEPPTQVNEVTMTLKVKGEFDKELKDWLINKGF